MLAIVTVALTAFSSPLRPARHAPPEDAFSAVQQLLATVGSAVLISTVAVVPPSFAEQAPMTTPECKLECKKECNALAPGNEGYCGGQCDDFCDNLAPVASTSAGMGAQVLRPLGAGNLSSLIATLTYNFYVDSHPHVCPHPRSGGGSKRLQWIQN